MAREARFRRYSMANGFRLYTLTMPKGEYLQYGGQAVVEGVMMRSPRYFSVACRAPNGEIVVETEAIEKTWLGKLKWMKTPFLRGSLALLDAMALGSKAMRFASNIQLAEEYQAVKEGETEVAAAAIPEKPSSKKVQDITVGATMVFALALGLGLFVYVPNLISEFATRALSIDKGFRNAIAELIKAVFFFAYIYLIGFLPDIKEVFRYHGAEHKAINTLEAEQDLEMAECLKQTRFHPRCGTSFAIIVLIIGFVVFSFLPRYPLGEHGSAFLNTTIYFFMQLCILPIIAGIAYELLRVAGKFRNTAIVNAMFKPGIWSQGLTTKEPDQKHIEVALTALKAVMAAEENGGVPKPEPVENAIESSPVVP